MNEDRLQASHDVRRKFETAAYILGGGIIAATMTLIVVGSAMPPPTPCSSAVSTCVPVADWGASIIARIRDCKDTLLDLLMALGGWTGITLARGHLDARLPDRKDDQPQ